MRPRAMRVAVYSDQIDDPLFLPLRRERFLLQTDLPCKHCGERHGFYTTGREEAECGVPILWTDQYWPDMDASRKCAPVKDQQFITVEEVVLRQEQEEA